jgi:hypothetical protein
VRRLFSNFATGAPGLGLLLLRLTAGIGLVAQGILALCGTLPLGQVLTPCADDRHRAASHGWLVDSGGGNDTGHSSVVARVPRCLESVDVCPHGPPRGRAGTSWTRSMVN